VILNPLIANVGVTVAGMGGEGGAGCAGAWARHEAQAPSASTAAATA
jgi:hypothetical protein